MMDWPILSWLIWLPCVGAIVVLFVYSMVAGRRRAI